MAPLSSPAATARRAQRRPLHGRLPVQPRPAAHRQHNEVLELVKRVLAMADALVGAGDPRPGAPPPAWRRWRRSAAWPSEGEGHGGGTRRGDTGEGHGVPV